MSLIMSLPRSSDVVIAMSELAAARAELARLQDRERELLEELRSVRTAGRVQKDKINDLFKQQRLPAPITRLPLTVLSDIIHRVIFGTRSVSDAHRCTKRQLAGVSRLWRDAILSFPNLWTTIAIDPSWSIPLVMAHVDRSGECPLNIIISNWSFDSDPSPFNNLFGVAITCGHRWRSLVIQQVSGSAAIQAVKSIWRMRFPSLERVKIFGIQISDNPPFLTSRYAPALKHLSLRGQDRVDQIPAASNLKTGHFHWSGSSSGSRLLSSLPSCQKLRKLVLFGSGGPTEQWPAPQSIHLPALVSLTLDLADPQPALAAMVVPNLIYLGCSRRSYRGWAHVFGGFPNVFTNVQHLRLVDETLLSVYPKFTEADAKVVCMACPGVQHVELPANVIRGFFHRNAPAGSWSHLERLTLKDMNVGRIPHGLIKWLDGRKSREQPLLRLALSGFRVPEGALDGPWLTTLYESLRGRCLLELKDVPLKTCLKARTLSQGVCVCTSHHLDAHEFMSRTCWTLAAPVIA
ncbi:hypothetical protein EDC04DRAFT_2089305 [Pisolithus marmoratus]|nr:hypothetical protein EDC04DRAFT_2089305 [Pisolithus marmoratus]